MAALCNILEQLVEAFRRGAVPDLCNAWIATSEAICRDSMQFCLEEYDREATKFPLPQDTAALQRMHSEQHEKVIPSFELDAIGDASVKASYKQKLMVRDVRLLRRRSQCLPLLALTIVRKHTGFTCGAPRRAAPAQPRGQPCAM